MKFDGITIVSDMDGTLLDEKKNISDKNLKKIRYFKENGGNFTIASGRLFPKIALYAELLSLDIPVIASNGAVIYDFLKKEVLYKKTMDRKCLKILPAIMERFPDAGVEVASIDHTNFIRSSEMVWKHIKDEEFEKDFPDNKIIWKEIDDVTSPITKIMFCDFPKKIEELEGVLPYAYSEYNFFKSDAYYYEMTGHDTSKGLAIYKLSEILGTKNRKLYAVGDSMNDLEMIKAADVGVCVKNGLDAIKNISDFILPYTNNEDAICHLIELIEKGLI